MKIGIVGCGVIGGEVARFIDRKLKNKTKVCAIFDIDKDKALNLKKKLSSNPRILDTDRLVDTVDLVIEAASVKAARYVLGRIVKSGKDVVILSVGALVANPSIFKKAEKRGSKIYVPSGAICGVDGLGALSLANIRSVSLITSKPPKGLMGADYLKKKKIDLTNLRTEKVIFKGGVKDAVKYFPKNINVAAILLLASGVKDVKIYIKANPKIKRNVHRIEIEAKEARINIEVENVPSLANPKTSTLAILSTQYLLKKMLSSFKIGN
jgi:aspartate dehydrogenase